MSWTSAAQASTLSDLAASMQPGTWAVLNTTGFNNGGLLEQPNSASDYITQFTEKAVWDVTSNQFLFLGAAHGNNCYAEFVLYSDASNTWTTGPMIPGYPGYGSSVCSGHPGYVGNIAHAYDHNAVDRAGNLYFHPYNTKQVWKYNVAGNAWSQLPDIPMADYQITGALEWFPDRGELIYADGNFGVWSWNPSTNQWTQIASTDAGGSVTPQLVMGDYQISSLYSPACKCILVGGGGLAGSRPSYLPGASNLIYAYNANGTWTTTLKATPFNLGIQASVISVDPVSGRYLVLRDMGTQAGGPGSGTQFWQYDINSDSWLQLPNNVPSPLYSGPTNPTFTVGDGLIATPISTYGVVMYVKYNNGNSGVYLYKHSAGGGTPPPPPPPPPPSACDVTGDGVVNVADVQKEVNMDLQIIPCTNPSGTCNVASVQKVVNAALGGTCVTP